MFSQLTVYAKIIYLLMVVISGALCTVEDYVIMSQCAHNKAIHLAAEGTVSVTDISQTQNITIVGLPDFVNNDYKIALYAKETKRYLCFNENWKLVAMQELQDTCYFNETIVHGYFVFRSVVDLQRRIGFTHRGKAIGPKKNVSNDACYMFTKIQADQFFHQQRAKIMASPPSSATMTVSTTAAIRTPSRSAALSTTTTTLNTHTHTPIKNNTNRRIHNKIQNQSHLNGHNSNISNKNYTNLSNITKQQQQHHHTREQVQRQHLVRHHHNDPNAVARRQHHEQKQKRRQQQQQHQQQRARFRTTTTTTASPKIIATTIISMKKLITPTATTNFRNFTHTAATASTTRRTTTNSIKTTTKTQKTPSTTVKNKHKGRKRKIERMQKKHAHHKQRLLHKLQQQQRLQQYRNGETTTTTSTTTQSDVDWSMNENWWSNFTDDYNNNTYNNNTDYGSSSEWLSVDPSPVSPLLRSTLIPVNKVSDSDESLGYFSSSTTSADFELTRSQSTDAYESSTSGNNWSSTGYTSLDFEFDNNENNESSESDTLPTEIWASPTPKLHLSPTTALTKVTHKKAHTVPVIETTTSTPDNGNSTDIFDLLTDAENIDNSSDHLSMSGEEFGDVVATTPLKPSHATLNSFVINSSQVTPKQQPNRTHTGKMRRVGSKSDKFVRKLAQPAATNAALTTKSRRVSTPLLYNRSTTPTTQSTLNYKKISNIIQIKKNVSEAYIHNSLSEKPEPSTRRASFSTVATTKEKSVRKSTQKLLATPFHQLIQYVRNDAGEIDIDNIDNISIYPEVSEESDLDYSGAQTESTKIKPNRRLAIVSGYLPTSASVVLPESIQIAKIKINKERKRMLRQRRRHDEAARILA